LELTRNLNRLDTNLKQTKPIKQNENKINNDLENNILKDKNKNEQVPLFSAEDKQESENNGLVTFNKDVQLITYDVNNDDPHDRSQTSIEIVKLKPPAENRHKKSKNKISEQNRVKIIKRIKQIENQINESKDHSLAHLCLEF